MPRARSGNGRAATSRGGDGCFAFSELDRLVDEAVKGNLAVSCAAARIREALDATAPSLDAADLVDPSKLVAGGGEVVWPFQAGLDAAWELGFFGGRRWAVEAAGFGDVALNDAEVRRAHPPRTFLATLGVIIGIASVVALARE